MTDTITIRGSWGALTATLQGEITGYDPEDNCAPDDPDGYGNIDRFNMDCWCLFYNTYVKAGDEFDICDLGYWHDNYEQYEPPVPDYRSLDCLSINTRRHYVCIEWGRGHWGEEPHYDFYRFSRKDELNAFMEGVVICYDETGMTEPQVLFDTRELPDKNRNH